MEQIKRRKRKSIYIPKQDLKTMLTAGWTNHRIGMKYGVTAQTVANVMKREGITRESVKE